MSYRTAPPRANRHRVANIAGNSPALSRGIRDRSFTETYPGLSRFGNDLLSHALRRSTIGATVLNGRVRDGIGCFTRAMITKPGKTWIRHETWRIFPTKFRPGQVAALQPERKPDHFWIEIKPIGQLVPVN